MKRCAAFRLRIAVCLGVLLFIAAAEITATNLTGTFKHPDGSLVNGKLIFLLSQPARLSDSSAQIVPMVKIFSVVNGTLETGAFVYGNDVLVPAGTHYLVRLVDSSNNLLFEQKWYISGTTLDLGTLTPTTTGVVLPDPLLRNTGTAQTVQGPVNFSSPITAFTLTLNGNLSPGAGDVFDLGNSGAPWRELFALRWNNFFQPGGQTSTVTNLATGPTVAVEATSGGSMDNSTRYYKIELINWNGTTLASPSTTLTPSTCGGAACQIRVAVAGTEWKTGAFAFRVLASSDNVNFFRQTGFPGELDTTGPIANAHMVPGDAILSSLTLSGTGPASANTATIDADQVALNAMCDRTNNICKGTLQYNASTGAGVAALTGTTPLVVGVNGARIRGHAGGIQHDTVVAGSTRQCNFAHVKIGCVMVIENRAVDIENLNIKSASNGLMYYKSAANGSATANNDFRFASAGIITTGTLVVDNIRIVGGHYYLNFPRVHLSTQTSGLSCAGVSTANAFGSAWLFEGFARWTIRDICHAVRSDKGKTDPDRNTAFQGLPSAVGEFTVKHIAVQSAPHGVPDSNRTMFLMENLAFNFDDVAASDWAPAAGAVAQIEMGCDADCATIGTATNIAIKDSLLGGTANATAAIKVLSNSSGAFKAFHIKNSYIGPAAASVSIDFNNIVLNTTIDGDTQISCDPNATVAKIINVAATSNVNCTSTLTSVASYRMVNLRVQGGTSIFAPNSQTVYFQCWWPTSNNYECYNGNGNTAANLRYRIVQGGNNTTWFQSDGSTTLLNLGANNIGIGRSNSGVSSTLAFPNNWSLTARNNANSVDLGLIKLNTSDQAEIGDASTPARFPRSSGNPPMLVDSTTEVSNLNAQKWHGKDAMDFSAPLDFGSIAAQTCAELTITVTGAGVDNDAMATSWPAALEAGLVGNMRISAADTVTVRLCNVTLLSIDPASRTYAGRVIK